MDDRLKRHASECFADALPDVPGLDRLLELVDADYGRLEAQRRQLEEAMARATSDLERQRRLLDQDAKDRQRLEVNLRQAEKLRAVGQLAAGIAHEINTPIQYVGDSMHFLREAFEDLASVLARYRSLREIESLDQELFVAASEEEEKVDLSYLLEQIPKAFDRTFEGVQRMTEIVKAMRAFAHPEQKERVLADVNSGLLSTLTVARNELKYIADVDVELGQIPQIECFPTELNQVFLNLLVNAAHAIADRPSAPQERGKISVRTSIVGDAVIVTISDNGCGIPEAIRDRVYDPFFTTKAVGRGSGQGLAIARSIVVEQHHGSISFASEVGKGTKFYVRLPIHPPPTVAPLGPTYPRVSGQISIVRP